MIEKIKELLIKYDKYYIKNDDIIIAFNKNNEYEKLDLVGKELYLDKSIYEKNFKKNHHFNYESEELIINNYLFYHFVLVPNKKVFNQESFLNKLEEIKLTKERPTLLMHSCCGPCSSYCLEYLYPYFDITILYYNPNIDTLEEFNKRLDYQKMIIDKLGYDIKIITPIYNHNEYLDIIKGHEEDKEGEKRCYICYEKRIEEVAKIANGKYDFFTTTLSVSPYKNATWINEIGERINKKYPDTAYLYANFKLNDGYKRSIELSKKYNLYRQDYCGCEFSYKNKITH